MSTLAVIKNRMSEDMRLKDFRSKTWDAYWRAVRQFLLHVKKEPAALTEQDVRMVFDSSARRENAGSFHAKHRRARTALLLHTHIRRTGRFWTSYA